MIGEILKKHPSGYVYNNPNEHPYSLALDSAKDLEYSLHNANILRVSYTNKGSLKVILEDRYDFDEIKNPDRLIEYTNNEIYSYQEINAIKNYFSIIEVEFIQNELGGLNE
ncbi:MAG: hypothetical protein PHV68_02550 [Candidatus Gastranaerophilales bacterium]|nr:hypothetical protein [Candidatus Gastranaerophilales bacterium]